MQAQASAGVSLPELQTPEPPAHLVYLLHWMMELAAARQSGFAGPQPLAWQDIEAWSRLTLTPLHPWEVRVLRRLDAAWIQAWLAGQPEKPGGAAQPAQKRQ